MHSMEVDAVIQKSNSSVLKSVLEANARHSDVKKVDILQFSSPEYYCTEGEGWIEIQIDRLGQCKETATVDFCTKDGSAKAGIKYVAQTGTLVFGPGATEQRLRIRILEDESFDSVLEFQVHLANSENAKVDFYLGMTEITIVDDDTFPTNRFREQIKKGHISDVTPHQMLIEFFKMNWSVKGIRHATLKNLVSDQVINLRFIWNILLFAFMIDKVLKPADGSKPPDDAFFRVFIIVLLSMVPHPIQWALNQLEAERRVAGKAIAPLQANLMRKFLNYSEPSRKSVANSDLTMSVTRDVPELVLEGFCMIFPILQKVGLLLMLGGLAVQRSSGIHRWLNVGFSLAYPIFMLLFLGLRERGTVRRRHRLFQAQTDLCSCVSKITEYFRLICDYYQKQETVDKFVDKVAACNRATTRFLKWSATNEQFAPFLTDIICAAFILSATNSVLDGGAVGEFVTGVTIFRGIGECYQGIYANFLTMQQSIAPLQNIVYYMNLPVDLTDRMVAHRRLLEELDKAQRISTDLLFDGKPHDCSLVQQDIYLRCGNIVEPAVYAQDLVQMNAEKLHLKYNLAGGDVKKVLDDTCFEIAQGKLVAVVGPRGSGKSSLLKLMAGVLVPTPGSGLFFMPPHLRVGHVTQHPEMIEDESVLENLVFGPSDGVDEDPNRVLAIMRRLGMSHEVIHAVKSAVSHLHKDSMQMAENAALGRNSKADDQEGTMNSVVFRAMQHRRAENDTRMSHTDRCLIHIARGLIMNPEVLVMHKPLAHFDRVQASRVLDLLREFVDMRGLEKPVEERVLRRPRTCIFSCAAMEGIDHADTVLQVDETSVQEINMNELKEMEAKAHGFFKEMDVNSDGVISKDEFCRACQNNPECTKYFGIRTAELTGTAQDQTILAAAFDKLDHTESGVVNFEELWHFMRHKMHMQMPTHSSIAGRRQSKEDHDRNAGVMKLLVEPDNGGQGLKTARWDIPEVCKESPMAPRKCNVSAGFGDR